MCGKKTGNRGWNRMSRGCDVNEAGERDLTSYHGVLCEPCQHLEFPSKEGQKPLWIFKQENDTQFLFL